MVTLKTLLTNVLKSLLNNIHLVKENIPTKEKKAFAPSSSILWNNIFKYIGRTKLQQQLKSVLNFCKLEIALNAKQGFPILFVTQTLHTKALYLVLFINFSVGFAMNPLWGKYQTLISDLRNIQLCHLLLEKKSNHQITVLFVIIYSTVIFYPLLTA